ncbi:carbon monoxide dehydrogenase subunit G, partial [Acinetobacter baumannii]|uniref:SRPBCC family protein n=2 Tax=Pseudomonadota TaxID=1224 RepID=UPI00332593DC
MTGEVQLPASRQVVWEKLNDPAVLKSCIPGCEELDKSGDNEFQAVAKMKVGPVSARFKGRVTLSDLDPPNGYKITGEGEGGVAGFA